MAGVCMILNHANISPVCSLFSSKCWRKLQVAAARVTLNLFSMDLFAHIHWFPTGEGIHPNKTKPKKTELCPADYLPTEQAQLVEVTFFPF